MSALNLIRQVNLSNRNENELRSILEMMYEHANSDDAEYPIKVFSNGREIFLHSADEIRAFREGFIMSRISAFSRVTELTWVDDDEPLN